VTSKFAPIVGKQACRYAKLPYQSNEHVDQMFVAWALPHLDGERLAAEHINPIIARILAQNAVRRHLRGVAMLALDLFLSSQALLCVVRVRPCSSTEFTQFHHQRQDIGHILEIQQPCGVVPCPCRADDAFAPKRAYAAAREPIALLRKSRIR
jgi:hypothetical protein